MIFAAGMDSQRQKKFSKLIQKDLSEIFVSDAKHLFTGTFITVTNVRITPDLGLAKIYLSFFLSKDQNALLENIRENGKEIKKLLAARIRNQARVIPELQFFIDDTAEYADKMNKIINDLNIPPEENKDKK